MVVFSILFFMAHNLGITIQNLLIKSSCKVYACVFLLIISVLWYPLGNQKLTTFVFRNWKERIMLRWEGTRSIRKIFLNFNFVFTIPVLNIARSSDYLFFNFQHACSIFRTFLMNDALFLMIYELMEKQKRVWIKPNYKRTNICINYFQWISILYINKLIYKIFFHEASKFKISNSHKNNPSEKFFKLN